MGQSKNVIEGIPYNIERHLSCRNYAQASKSIFATKSYPKGGEHTVKTAGQMALVFVEGKASRYTLNDEAPVRQSSSFVMLLDKDSKLNVNFYQAGRISSFRFRKLSRLCECYPITRLRASAPTQMVCRTLPINEPLQMALDSMVRYGEDSLRCCVVTESKLSEIFFVISAYYREDDLAGFLAPLLRKEIDFKDFVIRNYTKVNTVQELAELRQVSIRVFTRQFKESFGMPPYQWMLRQKGGAITRRLIDPNVSFSDIVKEFGFSSASHLTIYTRRQFDMTPTELRRRLLQGDTSFIPRENLLK